MTHFRIPIFTSPVSRLLVLGLLVLSLTACDFVTIEFGRNRDDGDKFARNAPAIAIPVETILPQRGNISTYFETTTRVEAERRVDILAKGNARCIELLVDEGDEVVAGQILAELDKDEAKASYAEKDVQVRQDQTAYELAKRQFEQGLGPKMEMDNAYYTYEQALATLESQRILLDNLTIKAPIDGIVTTRDITLGMLVSPGTQVFSLMDPSSFMLTIEPPEKELPRLKIGQKALVTIDSIRGREFEASIRRINPSVDPISGTVKVVLDFDDELQTRLHESAFARVKLVMATIQNVLLVPKEAIVEENGRKFLFLAREDESKRNADAKTESLRPESETRDGGKLLTPEVEASEKDEVVADASESAAPAFVAERIEIRTGLEDSKSVQIYSGLADGDWVIINGQHTLKDGALIRVLKAKDAIWSKSELSADEALSEAKKRREEGGGANAQGRNRGHFGNH